MNSQRAIKIIYSFFLLNLVIISWQEIKGSQSPIGWPRPQRFVGLAVVFTLLSVLSEMTAELAAVMSGGMTLGLLMSNTGNTASTQGGGGGHVFGIPAIYSQPNSNGLSGSVQV